MSVCILGVYVIVIGDIVVSGFMCVCGGVGWVKCSRWWPKMIGGVSEISAAVVHVSVWLLWGLDVGLVWALNVCFRVVVHDKKC